MDNFSKKAIINDELFEKEYFEKYVKEIRSWEEYKELERIINNTNYTIKLEYSSGKSFRRIYYDIDFGVYDELGNLIAIPEDSEFYDYSFHLCASAGVLSYNTRSHKIIEAFDSDELRIGIVNAIDYLKSLR